MEEYSIIALPEIREMVVRHLESKDLEEIALVSPAFYQIVCRIDQDVLKLDEKILNNNIFEAMMHSNRRFSNIKVNVWNIDAQHQAAERIIAIVSRFKRKTLIISNFPYRVPRLYTNFLNSIADVEDLSLPRYNHGEFVPQVKFSNLKQLSVENSSVITVMESNIPDNCLEGLTCGNNFSDYTASADKPLQALLNRQMKLTKLNVYCNAKINIDHLALRQLFLPKNDSRDDGDLAALLKNQRALTELWCGMVGSKTFDELQKMPNLEVLRAGQCSSKPIIELKNLKELELQCCRNFRQRTILLEFEKLKLVEESEFFIALSRNAPNLQHIAIANPDISFLPTIIEQCQALKTLLVDFYYYDEGSSFPAPSRQNLGLEELLLRKRWRPAPIRPLYDLINACPNLKRLQLQDFTVTNRQFVRMLHSHRQITHFWFGTLTSHPLGKYENEVNLSKRLTLKIIKNFENSPNFINLAFWNITEGFDKRIESMIRKHFNQFHVRKFKKSSFGNCLKLCKKSCAYDPFQNFHEKVSSFL